MEGEGFWVAGKEVLEVFLVGALGNCGDLLALHALWLETNGSCVEQINNWYHTSREMFLNGECLKPYKSAAA